MTKRSARALSASAVLMLIALSVLLGARLRIDTEITEFMPAGVDAEMTALSRALTGSDLSRTLTLVLSGEDPERATAAARSLAERLGSREDVEWVRAGPDEALEQSFYELYFPRRLTLRDPDVPLDFRARAASLKERLGSPAGAFVRRIATSDPWLLFLDQSQALQSGGDELLIREGTFVLREDESQAVILVATKASPFEGGATRSFLEELEEEVSALQATHGELTLSQASVHRIAVASERVIRADIERVSTFGTIGVLLLLGLLFQSPRPLLLSTVPIAGGVIVGAGAVFLFFDGRIHGLTLAFGATLIGVALDYVAHLFNHHRLGETGAEETAKEIWPGLLVGALTTIAGLVGLAWSSFPGIQQMATFASAGIAAALLLTRYALPPWMSDSAVATRPHRALGSLAAALLDGLRRFRGAVIVLPLLAIGLSAVGIPQASFIDDIRALNPVPAELLEEDEHVRGQVARMEAARFAAATGDTLEEALQRSETARRVLLEAVEAGELEHFRSITPMVVSRQWQRRAIEELPDDAFEQTVSALEQEGFVRGMFTSFEQTLQEEASLLEWSSLDNTPLAPLRNSFHVDLPDGRHGLLTFLQGVQDPAALQRRLESVEGVRFFDQNGYMADAYRRFRTRAQQLIGVGLIAILFLVFVRYRSLRRSLAAFLPALLSCAATVGVLGILGVSVSLLHWVALLLVLSMGVDYGVFMVEAAVMEERDGAPGYAAATSASLLMACASTVLSFGVLALSEHPALSAIGLTSAVGVAFSLVLAPIAFLWLAQD